MTSRHAGVWPHPADMKTCLANPALQFPACSLHAVRIHFSVPCGSGICNSRWQIQHSVLIFSVASLLKQLFQQLVCPIALLVQLLRQLLFCSCISIFTVAATASKVTCPAALAASVLQLLQQQFCCSCCSRFCFAAAAALPSCFSSLCLQLL